MADRRFERRLGAANDFSEMTRQAISDEVRVANKREAERRAAEAVAQRRERDDALREHLMGAAIRLCVDELQRLKISSVTSRVNVPRKRRRYDHEPLTKPAKVKGWQLRLPLYDDELWQPGLPFWLDNTANRWYAAPWDLRDGTPVCEIGDRLQPITLPKWDLRAGNGRNSEHVGTVAVHLDDTVAGGLRCDQQFRRHECDVSEPFHDLLARGIARAAVRGGRIVGR